MQIKSLTIIERVVSNMNGFKLCAVADLKDVNGQDPYFGIIKLTIITVTICILGESNLSYLNTLQLL